VLKAGLWAFASFAAPETFALRLKRALDFDLAGAR
jgi:hypothetical protein